MTRARTLAQIGDSWDRVKDLRLGQLLWNAVHEKMQPVDLFFIEDQALVELVEAFVTRLNPPAVVPTRVVRVRTKPCRQCNDEYTPGCFTDDGFCSDSCMNEYDAQLDGGG